MIIRYLGSWGINLVERVMGPQERTQMLGLVFLHGLSQMFTLVVGSYVRGKAGSYFQFFWICFLRSVYVGLGSSCLKGVRAENTAASSGTR